MHLIQVYARVVEDIVFLFIIIYAPSSILYIYVCAVSKYQGGYGVMVVNNIVHTVG